jgi:hypothetical protein
VQLSPIKPSLKALGSTRLKLKFVKPFSIFAFKFNLRRYILGLKMSTSELDVLARDAVGWCRLSQ